MNSKILISVLVTALVAGSVGFFGEETKISESTPSTKDKLTEGTPVFITGTENSDGSLTAASIQIGE